MINTSIIFVSSGILSTIIGTIFTFKNNPPLIGFGCYNGPSIDKKKLSRARLGLGLLVFGIIIQGIGNLIDLITR